MHILICVFLRMLVCAGACVYIFMYVEAQDIVCLPRSLSSLNVEVGSLIFSASLTSQLAIVIPCSCLCHTGIIDRLPYLLGLFMGAGTRTLVLMHEHQVQYLLKHFLHPSTDTFSPILKHSMLEQKLLLLLQLAGFCGWLGMSCSESPWSTAARLWIQAQVTDKCERTWKPRAWVIHIFSALMFLGFCINFGLSKETDPYIVPFLTWQGASQSYKVESSDMASTWWEMKTENNPQSGGGILSSTHPHLSSLL